jgi:hypothetical protein
MTKTVKQHEDESIHFPRSWGVSLFLIAIYLIGAWLIWQDFSLAAAHKEELDEISWLNLIYCLGFVTPVYLIEGSCIYITIKIIRKNSLLQLPLLMLLSLLLPLLLSLLLPRPLLLMLLPLLPLLLSLLLLSLLPPEAFGRAPKQTAPEKPILCHCFREGHPKQWCDLPIMHKGKCRYKGTQPPR